MSYILCIKEGTGAGASAGAGAGALHPWGLAGDCSAIQQLLEWAVDSLGQKGGGTSVLHLAANNGHKDSLVKVVILLSRPAGGRLQTAYWQPPSYTLIVSAYKVQRQITPQIQSHSRFLNFCWIWRSGKIWSLAITCELTLTICVQNPLEPPARKRAETCNRLFNNVDYLKCVPDIYI